jgi:hypothetical protein
MQQNWEMMPTKGPTLKGSADRDWLADQTPDCDGVVFREIELYFADAMLSYVICVGDSTERSVEPEDEDGIGLVAATDTLIVRPSSVDAPRDPASKGDTVSLIPVAGRLRRAWCAVHEQPQDERSQEDHGCLRAV